MRITTSEFSYGISVNMSVTVRVYGLAGVAPVAIFVFDIAPDRWKSRERCRASSS